MAIDSPLQRTAPEAQGISSTALLRFVEAAEKNINELHSLMLLRHGCVVAEGWWAPYGPEYPHMLFSLSKSFTSTAVGLAVMEGRLSVDDRVLSFFPEEAPAAVSENLAAMRVRRLLSMGTGHEEDTTQRMREQPEGKWVKGFLALPVEHAPGTHFVYNSGASHMLSAIVQKLTGMKLLDYLQPRLFEPLGIKNATWEISPEGVNFGGWGLSIKTEDIARFGQMYLQKGMWRGKRILPEAWIDAATSHQISNGSSAASDWTQGYGYQFWRCRHGAYRGDGAFGQFCLVMPDQDAVLAITAGVPDMQAVLNRVWDQLLPALNATAPLAADAPAQEALTRKLSSLAFSPPRGALGSPVAARISGKTYVLEANEPKFESFVFNFAGSDCGITVRNEDGEHRIVFGHCMWQEGVTTLFGFNSRLVASSMWTAEDTLVATLRPYETPFVYTLTCHFIEDRLTADVVVNVSFGPTQFQLAGRIA